MPSGFTNYKGFHKNTIAQIGCKTFSSPLKIPARGEENCDFTFFTDDSNLDRNSWLIIISIERR
jgi:hypothetical protein